MGHGPKANLKNQDGERKNGTYHLRYAVLDNVLAGLP